MKVIKQDENGRIVIDGEGERVELHHWIPGESPAVLVNFCFASRKLGQIKEEGRKEDFIPDPATPQESREEHLKAQVRLLLELCKRLSRIHYATDVLDTIVRELTAKKRLSRDAREHLKKIMKPNSKLECNCNACGELHVLMELNKKDLERLEGENSK